MASGGGPPRKVSASEGRAHRTWKRSNSTADGDDNASMTSNPLDARPNNWDFSDWQPSSAIDAGKRRKKAKANPEREREKERERERERSLSQDSSPQAAEKHHRTPSTFPRTKGTQAGQKLALENLRQHMTFSDLEDQLSNDGERNNARKVTLRRDRQANYTRQDTSGSNGSNMRRHGSAGDARTSDNRNNNREDIGPDTNHIVSRLMQIRDYIKQASSMMNTLQKSPNPQSVSEVENVRKLLTNLREQEKSYMTLLQQLLALRDEASAAEHNPNDARNMVRVKAEPLDETASLDLDVRSEVSDATTERTQSSSSRPRIEDKLGVDSDSEVRSLTSPAVCDQMGPPPALRVRLPSWDYEASRYESEELRRAEDGLSERKNELAMLKEQEELLKTLVEQQEQLRALQGKQESLLAMQKDAESRLKLAKARRNAAELASNVDVPQPPNIPAEPLSDAENATGAQGEIPPELENLRHRLDYLKKNIYDVKSEVTVSEPIEVNRNPDGSISDAGRKQLQDKLQELQNKKKRMDDLVSELQGLKSMRVEQLLNGDSFPGLGLPGDLRSTALSQAQAGESLAAASGGPADEEDEATLLEVIENQNKLKKLQEVRGRLNQLRQLVGYFQGGSLDQPMPGSSDQADQSSLPGVSDNDDLDITVQSNLRSPAMAMRTQTVETGTPATEQTDSQQQSDDDNMPASDTSETGSRTSSLGPWGDDPEIQEKVRKLKAAKDKLRQLQNMVNSFQQHPETSSVLPDDLAQLANSLDEEMEAVIPGSSALTTVTDVTAQLQDNSSSAMSDGELPQQAGERGEADFEATMQTQQKELDQLKVERENLIAIRDQLKLLHQQYPSQGDDEEPVRVPDRNNTEVKFAPEPQIQTITFSSNDELYDRMRKQRILREELRQKKRELEAIMRKDRPKKQYSRNQDNQSDTVSYSTEAFGTSVVSADATMATWGGSTVENLESITEDEDNTQEDGEEEDAYPIDGIVQVEEEEEENEESGETYTIEDDVRQRQEARQQQQRRERSSRKNGRQTYPRPLGDMTGASRNSQRQSNYDKKKWSNLNNRTRAKTRQGNYRSPEDIIEEDEQRGQLTVLQRQLETTNSLCQSLLQEQQSLYQMFRACYTTPAGLGWNGTASFRQGMFQDPFALPPPLQQQQQVMFRLNQCYQQMALQQSELQSLQNQLQCLSLQIGGNSPNPENQGLNNSTKLSPVTQGIGYNPYQVPLINSSNQASSFSLNPQFPASFSFLNNPNAYAAANGVDVSNVRGRTSSLGQGGGDGGTLGMQAEAHLAREPFNNNRLSSNRAASTKGLKKNNTSQSATQTCPLNAPASWSVVSGREPFGQTSPEAAETVPRLNLNRILATKRSRAGPLTSTERNPPLDESAVIGRVYSGSGRATAAANLASKKKAGELYRGGLSAGISGTAHADSASVSSVLSSVTGNQRNRNRDTDTSNDLSLFNALRENIYAEVATLISQNENRPHFLIELFKDLQLLSTDYLRQTALFSIREMVSRYLPDDNVESGTEPLPPWLTSTRATNSELTPSESLLTSDDEDLNERLDRRMAETRTLTRQILQRTGSLNHENFDYVETAENTSSLSTPSTTSFKESPFAQDSLGDTVIHLDQALRRMREYEQQKTEAEHAEKVRKLTEKQSHQKKAMGSKGGTRSEEAGDGHSDSSASDVPHPRIDTQQLDHQIKSIMTEVIPVIKEHMEDVCSPPLLDYIKRLVVSLTRNENKGQDVARFFNRQLGSILRDSLVKFEGRKLRDCGEDLLVELSEVLFNELAFCRLLRDLDDPAVATIQPKFHSNEIASSSSTSAGQRIVNYDPDSTDGEGSDSTSLDGENEAELGAESEPMDSATQAGASEVEDLGKRRDDALANEIRIQDADEKDDEPESAFKSVIELAVSETKPFTRIGSDEDDDESDESLSAGDPSETAVSRDAKLEQTVGLEILDADGQPSQAEEAGMEGDITVLEVTPVQERGENLEAAGASPARVNGTAPVLVNGDAAGELNGEVTVEDLPVKLSVISQGDLANQMSEEQAANSESVALVTNLETDDIELAGDGQALKEPDCSSC
ncbi:pericentriolar material 1 protein-like isoform X3 [Liolophura sinensis]|uniref:pericentriolar material 1 protein-like isoform X3 n=1 Tax=Liolophura sinensis TaxID=3198878 RepID=UPI003158CE2D